ncbi:MAG: HEPN domain-containing protein [Candidatus Poribacteria bacterium]|nr:HEPN domain-containing protein [Candidatus Poribacteria bacterium]
MTAADRFAQTARWLRYAEEDLRTAESLLRLPHGIPRHACWLAQQAAEKALKAVLTSLQIDFPRTHDLDTLRNLVPDGWHLKDAHPDLVRLTEWTVEARYPGDWAEPTDEEAKAAVEQARTVCTSVTTELSERGLL